MAGKVMLWNGKVLFRAAYGSRIAISPACCCGYSGPCPETCGCCEEYEGPTLATLGFEPCFMQFMPTRLLRSSEGACGWSVWLRALGINNEDYGAGWPDPGNWLASDGTSGALPAGCLEEWGDWYSTGAGIYCANGADGNAQWYYRISGTGQIGPFLPEFKYCGDLGRGACPKTGSFIYNAVDQSVACEADPEVWGDAIEGTLTGVDCNPFP